MGPRLARRLRMQPTEFVPQPERWAHLRALWRLFQFPSVGPGPFQTRPRSWATFRRTGSSQCQTARAGRSAVRSMTAVSATW
jgi:hypothetical protein